MTLTPAWHNWQNEYSKYNYREWKKEDYCGYLFDTVDSRRVMSTIFSKIEELELIKRNFRYTLS